MSSVSVFSGLVTRTWSLPSDTGKASTISLQHHTVTGSRQLSIDGADVPGTLGSNSIAGGTSTLTFDVAGKRGQVTITRAGTKFTYLCAIDGVSLLEENESGVTLTATDALLDIAVEDGDVTLNADRKSVVWYRIRTTPKDGGASVVVHRRFREFHAVDETLKSSYKGSPLLTSFPALPSRGFKLFTNHLAPAFIEQRRAGLQSYLQTLARIPRMTTNADFLLFLGIADDIKECSVVFSDGPMGISLKGGRSGAHHYVAVTNFTKRPDGSPAAAEASGLVAIGDKVSKVDGDDVLEVPYDVVIAKIKSAPRPLVLHFLGLKTAATGVPMGHDAAPTSGAGAAVTSAPAPPPAVAAAVVEPSPTLAPAPAPPAAESFGDDLDLL